MRTEGPLYHMHEVTGEMTKIILGFMEGQNLDLIDLNRLRFYMYQWISAMENRPATYQNVLVMTQPELMVFYLDELLPRGIDPF